MEKKEKATIRPMIILFVGMIAIVAIVLVEYFSGVQFSSEPEWVMFAHTIVYFVLGGFLSFFLNN